MMNAHNECKQKTQSIANITLSSLVGYSCTFCCFDRMTLQGREVNPSILFLDLTLIELKQ